MDLYGGTRHSTTTALGEYFTEQEIMEAGSVHKTDKAFRRYMQARKNMSHAIYGKAAELQKEVSETLKDGQKEDSGGKEQKAQIIPFRKAKS